MKLAVFLAAVFVFAATSTATFARGSGGFLTTDGALFANKIVLLTTIITAVIFVVLLFTKKLRLAMAIPVVAASLLLLSDHINSAFAVAVFGPMLGLAAVKTIQKKAAESRTKINFE